MMNKVKFTDFLDTKNINDQPNKRMKKMIFRNVLPKYIVALLLLLGSVFANAQCTPVVILDDGSKATTGVFCEGQIVSFEANSPGYTSKSTDWDFGYNGNTSANEKPKFAYSKSGTYTVTFKGEGGKGKCTETLTVIVRPSPDIYITRDNDTVQCYENNLFCFTDTSKAPDGLIERQTYVFSNGLRIDSLNPVFPLKFCVNITDPTGGFFHLVIESLDTSGCLTRIEYRDFIFTHPKLGVGFDNITPKPNPGCDSTLGIFKNSTLVPLASVDTFSWIFGDGVIVSGNSTTNTEWWVGEKNDGVITHMYNTHGSFDGSLAVTAYGCSDTFEWKAAVANIVMFPKILSTPNPACTPDNPIEFSVAGLPSSPGVDAFLWNFGDPPSGPANTEDKTLTPTKSYGPGPWMISLRLRAGPCDVTIYDTVQLIGPGSTIEVVGDRVAEDETYQCVIEDSIHFPNNSSFYQNDWNQYDEDSITFYFDFTFDREFDNTTGLYDFYYREWEERPRGNFNTHEEKFGSFDTITKNGYKVYWDATKDSLAVISGADTIWAWDHYGDPNNYRTGSGKRRRFVFKYTPPVGKGGVGVGDQTAEDPAEKIRGYNPNVWRVWEMGDRYAPQCTTDSRPWVNKNVGVNCNWTIDSNPVHWYTPWDEIYETFQDGRNYTTPYQETRLFKPGPSCYNVNIYPSLVMVVPGDTVITVPIDSSFTYRGVTIPAGMTYPHEKLGNWVVRRPPSCFIGTEVYWDAARDTFVAVNNLTDTTYHVENWLGRNNKVNGNGKTTWTVTFFDMEFYIPAGVTITTLKLAAPGGGGTGIGNTRTLTGPQTVVLEADEQFYLQSKDSIKTKITVEENDPDTTYAQPTTYPAQELQFGVLVTVNKSAIFVDSAGHRENWFIDNAQCFTVNLWQKDTIHPLKCEATGTKSLALIPPNAKGLEWKRGIPCPFDGNNLNYVLGFDISETKPGCTQRWFAVNLDSFANPAAFIPFDGGLLAPPPPGAPIPFVLPYSIRGNLGTEFVKGYTNGEIGDPTLRTPFGSFTLGLIVGNGKMVANTAGATPAMVPECLDTFWYSDLFRILYLNPDFSIVSPNTAKKVICAGGDAYFRIDDPIQDSISTLVWRWGYQGIGRGPNLDIYVEEFKYYEKYTGPVSGRNDENVVYSGEDWLYNYVIRQELSDLFGQVILDTIVTTIIKDWKIVANTRNAGKIVKDIFEQQLGLYYAELPPEDIPLYLGDGTFGCIDTTGLSQFFTFGIQAYSEKRDADVWLDGDKRYRCTSYSPLHVKDTTFVLDITGARVKSVINPGLDSIASVDSVLNRKRADCISSYEVTNIIHFRDSSLRGYDTLMIDVDLDGDIDTLTDVWKKSYTYPVLVPKDPCDPTGAKDTIYRNANGPMAPTLSLSNTVGCNVRSSKILNVGFYNDFWMDNVTLCQGLNLVVEDSLRYYQYGEEDPFTYPIKNIAFWQDRYAASIEKYEVDWGLYTDKDSFDFERSILLNHTYLDPGKYDVTIVSTDSIGCKDTVVLEAFVSKLNPDFIMPTYVKCEAIISFLDSSWVVDPCNDNGCNNSEDTCEQIIRWEWDFGDGTRKSILQNPNHNFTSGGYFDIKLKVWSKLGCIDSITKRLYIPGPQPEFRFDLLGLKDTAWICLGDSVFLQNLSVTDATKPDFVMYWGDGVSTQPDSVGAKFGHAYQTADTFYLFLEQQEQYNDDLCKRYFPDTNPDLLVQRKILVIVYPKPRVNITASDTVVCPDEVITFTGDIDARYSRMKWFMGDDANSILSRNVSPDGYSVSFSYAKDSTYSIVLAPEYDELPRCWARDTIQVRVVDVVADFDIDSSANPLFCFTNTSEGAEKYEWTFEDEPLNGTSEEVDPCYDWGQRLGEWEVCLIAISAEGCADTICKTINNSFYSEIKFFNVFTPNGGAENEEFVVEGESVETFEIKIFNRWGERVFESNDINYSWNGRVDNTGLECPEGTYFYIVNYKLIRGEENNGRGPVEGQVELIRNN